MKVSDKVRIIEVPPGLPEGDLKTRSLFEACVGQVFPVLALKGELIELEVGEVRGEAPCMHSIWIEPEFVEMVEPTS